MQTDKAESETSGATLPASQRAWIGYVVPMVVFLVLTALEGWEGLGLSYPLLYAFKVIVVTAAMWMSRKVWKDIQPNNKMLAIGLLFGAIGCVEWILVDRYTPHFKFLGTRTAYNPFHEIHSAALRILFITVRFYGLVLLVPVMEELFWRSFLLRWITDPEFVKLKLGEFSWTAFAIVAGAFAVAHPEWLAAVIYAAGLGLLLKRTGSLYACIVTHAATNLLLGIYVLYSGNWKLW